MIQVTLEPVDLLLTETNIKANDAINFRRKTIIFLWQEV